MKNADFDKVKIKICRTPEAVVRSNPFEAAIVDVLESPEDMDCMREIVKVRIADEILTDEQMRLCEKIRKNKNMIKEFNAMVTKQILYPPEQVKLAKKEHRDLPLFDDTFKPNILKVLTWLEGPSKGHTGPIPETFCGISIDELSPMQKKFFDKLIFIDKFTPKQIRTLGQRIKINAADGQIIFLNLKLALQDTDSRKSVVPKHVADAIVNALNDGSRLPKDADYNAMIGQMPGNTFDEQVENFRLLTGMNNWYWTGDQDNEGYITIRQFVRNKWSKHIEHVDSHTSNNIRLVKDRT